MEVRPAFTICARTRLQIGHVDSKTITQKLRERGVRPNGYVQTKSAVCPLLRLLALSLLLVPLTPCTSTVTVSVKRSSTRTTLRATAPRRCCRLSTRQLTQRPSRLRSFRLETRTREKSSTSTCSCRRMASGPRRSSLRMVDL